MVVNTFFPVTFFSDVNFFFKVLQHKEEVYENKVMQKKNEDMIFALAGQFKQLSHE